MKIHFTILAGMLGALAHAQVYPHAPGTDELIPQVIKDRKAKAPYYAESPAPSVIPSVRELAKFVELPALRRIVSAPVNTILPRYAELTPGEVVARSLALRSLDAHPDHVSSGPVSPRVIDPPASSTPLALLAATPAKSLPSWTNLSVDPFMLKVEFIWKRPHSQWMNSLLKQIDAAKAAGDTETYNTLTARYSAWAEKYLRHESNPPADHGP